MKTGNDPVQSALAIFKQYKSLADKALGQIQPEDWFYAPDPESNSIAIIVKHMAGNMRSRWSDFLTTDGEKPWRNRDSEFEIQASDTAESLMQQWQQSWQILFQTLETLTTDEMSFQVKIRGESHSILEAINRQIAHYSYHTGQIVYLAKHLRSTDWKTLSIAKGKSDAYNQKLFNK